MKLPRIRKHWQGFIPQYVAHPQNLCAFYHCDQDRYDGRYCKQHAKQYLAEVKAQGGAKLLAFPRPEPTAD